MQFSTIGTKWDSLSETLNWRLNSSLASCLLSLGLYLLYTSRTTFDFAYMGYTAHEVHPVSFAWAILAVAATSFLMPHRLSGPGCLVLWFLYLVTVIPSLTVPHYAGPLDAGEASTLTFWVLLSFALVLWLYRMDLFARVYPVMRLSESSFTVLIAIACAGALTIVVLINGMPTSLPSLREVYETRAEYKAAMAGSGLLAPLVSLLAVILNPAVIVFGLRRRILWLISMGVAGQLLLFGITGMKSFVFSLAAIIGFWVLFAPRNMRFSRFAVSLVWAACCLVTVAAALDFWFSWNTVNSLLVRRLMITPGLLSGVYFDLFQGAEKAHWAHSFLSDYLHYSYSQKPSYLVGTYYFNNPETHANANLFADGYANLGVPGMFIEALLLGLMLCLVKSAARGLALRETACLFSMSAVAFTNTSPITATFTHGALFAVLVCGFYPRPESTPVPSKKPDSMVSGADIDVDVNTSVRSKTDPSENIGA